MTSHIEIKAIIQSQTDEENLLESIFGQMGFKEINLMKTKFFYCTSNEIGVLLKQISVSPLCCNLFIYTR